MWIIKQVHDVGSGMSTCSRVDGKVASFDKDGDLSWAPAGSQTKHERCVIVGQIAYYRPRSSAIWPVALAEAIP
jgi:hypothetical protein|tara:strand:- start:42840 stop:43061 length:222 start_codon:yes stop_codon:yes gene_type:complete